MNDKFDAYHVWLGIPSKDQPPHHYRLLGIEPFERNREVIERAADRQIVHLKTYQSGRRAALSQRLLNEVSAAAGCLLDPAKKAVYDARLKAALEAKADSQPAFPVATPVSLNFAASSGVTAKARPGAKSKAPAARPLREMIKIFGGGTVGIFLAVLVLSYFAGIDPLGWSKKSREAHAKKLTSADQSNNRKSVNAARLPDSTSDIQRVDAAARDVNHRLVLNRQVETDKETPRERAESPSPSPMPADPALHGNVAIVAKVDLPISPPPEAAIPAAPPAVDTNRSLTDLLKPASGALDGKVQPQLAEALAKLQKPIASYQTSLLTAKKGMLNDFAQGEAKVRASKTLSGTQQLAVLERLKEEQAAFNDHGYLPFSQAMRSAWIDYVRITKNAEEMLDTAFDRQIRAYVMSNNVEVSSLLEKERDQLLARTIVARWMVATPWTLWSDGTAHSAPPNERMGTWKIKGNAFIVDWPPYRGKVVVDTCSLNILGNHFDGKNQDGIKFSGNWMAPPMSSKLSGRPTNTMLTQNIGVLEQGFVHLFDGKTLDGWQGDKSGYDVVNGAIVCQQNGNGNLYTAKEYSDFHLKFEFKLTPGANNGIGIRTPLNGDPGIVGLEIQVLDDASDQYRSIKAWQYNGSVYGVVPAITGHLRRTGEWNSEEIVVRGKQVTVILNGVTIVDADVEKASASGTVDGHEHPGLKRKMGYICICGHRSHVEFRNLAIKELK